MYKFYFLSLNIYLSSDKWPVAVRANGHLLLNSEKVRLIAAQKVKILQKNLQI